MSNPNKAKVYCIAAGCKNNEKNSNYAFFSVPLGQSLEGRQRCEKWLTRLGRKDLFAKTDLRKRSYKVCSKHFDDSSMKLVKVLKKDAVPSLFLAEQDEDEDQSESDDDSNDKSTQTTTTKKQSAKQTKEKDKAAENMLNKTKKKYELNKEPLDKPQDSTFTEERSTMAEIMEVYANETIEKSKITKKLLNKTKKNKETYQEPFDKPEDNTENRSTMAEIMRGYANETLEVEIEIEGNENTIKEEPLDYTELTPPSTNTETGTSFTNKISTDADTEEGNVAGKKFKYSITVEEIKQEPLDDLTPNSPLKKRQKK